MKIVDFPQGTPEWAAARAGKVTASCMDKVLAKIKVGEAAARRDYRAQIVAEILTGAPQDSGYINAEMQWGIEQEPFARGAYEAAQCVLVDEVGFVIHPTLERAGASPDGLVGTDGLIEIKCPKTATHLQYLLDGAVPKDYEPQMMWQLACTGRAWCDFVSFDPRLPEKMQMLRVRLQRDDARIAELEAEVRGFLLDVDRMLETVRRFA
ncbi:MAG TPA: YqaJ viral recombinase family protein [Kofleriaceae bacterium]